MAPAKPKGKLVLVPEQLTVRGSGVHELSFTLGREGSSDSHHGTAVWTPMDVGMDRRPIIVGPAWAMLRDPVEYDEVMAALTATRKQLVKE